VNRLSDYVEHITQAASQACAFVEGFDRARFESDLRTQKAVVMSLFIVGEAAAKIMEGHKEFADRHSEIPWRSMRGMRNRIGHGYFDINLEVVWDTVKVALPELLQLLPAVLADANRSAT
jgi:uncharacterized protein with HEPN domain